MALAIGAGRDESCALGNCDLGSPDFGGSESAAICSIKLMASENQFIEEARPTGDAIRINSLFVDRFNPECRHA